MATRGWVVACVLLCAPGIGTGTAHAFTVESSFTDGCHERIAWRALHRAIDELVADEVLTSDDVRPPDLTRDDRLVVDDLPFRLPSDYHDRWTLALVLGARDIDLGGRAVDDLADTSVVHNDPERQDEHCLRGPGHDNPSADSAGFADEWALDDCRLAILDEVDEALRNNDDDLPGIRGIESAGDETHLDAVERFRVALAFRGEAYVELHRFFWHMGRAIHIAGDSFTHAFRGPHDSIPYGCSDNEELPDCVPDDAGRISTDGCCIVEKRWVRHVLNWIDVAIGPYDEARDGHEHMSVLDQCEGDTGPEGVRVDRAERVSKELLEAVLDPTRGNVGRNARVQAVLDRYIALDPTIYGCQTGERYLPCNEKYVDAGCTYDNEWCGAPERAEESPCLCSAPGASSPDAPWLGISILGGILVIRRTRRRTRTAVLALALLAAPAVASAEDEGTEEGGERTQRLEASTDFEQGCCLGLYTGGGASIHYWGVAAVAGVRWKTSDAFVLGIDAEYNPWYSFAANRISSGAANVYATSIITLRRFEDVELRTTGHLGVSVLLFALHGFPAGSIGGYIGWSLLGVAFPIGHKLKLVVDPAHVAVPSPAIEGVPFFYIQYRSTVGVEWMP